MGGLKTLLGVENVEPAVVMLVDLPSLKRGHKKPCHHLRTMSSWAGNPGRPPMEPLSGQQDKKLIMLRTIDNSLWPL